MYHPRDTVALWRAAGNNIADNPWYHINYFQTKNHREKKSNDRMFEMKRSLAPTAEGTKALEQYLNMRLESLLEQGSGTEVVVLEGQVDELILPGLGSKHVREIGITLHHIFGVPYLPASSLKGVVRSWALQAFAYGKEEEMEKGSGVESEYFRAIFGTQEREGTVQFYDVFFESGFEIVKDVLTVHYQKYYGRQESVPAFVQPVPVSFYGVKGKKPRILFAVTTKPSNPKDIALVVENWIRRALTEIGIGSKTASGYGRFAEVINVTEDIVREFKEKKQRELKRKKLLLEEKIEKQREEELLSSLTEGARLAYEIEKLSLMQQDSDKSKTTFYQQVINLQGEERRTAAQALKDYWEKTGDWKQPSKRQKEKNQKIREILEEI